MINIGEISKPSVEKPSKGSSVSQKRAEKVDGLSPIDATRQVKAATRDAKKKKKSEPHDEQSEALDSGAYDESGRTKSQPQIDLKA